MFSIADLRTATTRPLTAVHRQVATRPPDIFSPVQPVTLVFRIWPCLQTKPISLG